MITGRRAQLEARLRSRGYTLEEVRACVASENGDFVTVDETHPAYPRVAKPGLGDMVKAGLSAIGITEERVSKALGRPCGCSKRASTLNKLGTMLGLPPGQS